MTIFVWKVFYKKTRGWITSSFLFFTYQNRKWDTFEYRTYRSSLIVLFRQTTLPILGNLSRFRLSLNLRLTRGKIDMLKHFREMEDMESKE